MDKQKRLDFEKLGFWDEFPEKQSKLVEVKKKTYKLKHPRNYKQYDLYQSNEKSYFLEILDGLADIIKIKDKNKSKRGRPSQFRELVKCCMMKTYTTFSARRLKQELKQMHTLGFIKQVPHFNTINTFLRNPKLENVLEDLITLSAIPLRDEEHFTAIDATGFSSQEFSEKWLDARTDRTKIRNFVKAHVIIGCKNKIILVAKASEGRRNDTIYFKPLLSKACKYFNITQISADKGYSSRENHNFAEACGVIPYIDFKVNATATPKSSNMWKKMFKIARENPEFFDERYHKRSLVESVFSATKRKFVSSCKAKSEQARKNEILMKLLCHNLCVLIKHHFENED